MINMVDLLLEEVEQDIKRENFFNRFLEDISIYNEDNPQPNNNPKNQNNNQQQNQNNNQQQNQNNNQQQNQNNNQQQNQNNNQQQNQNNNPDAIINNISNKLNNIVSSCDTFLEKQTRKISEGLSNINQKVNENKYVKLANDISLDTIEILKVPKTVLKAGQDFQFVGKFIDKWMGGVLSGLREQCQIIMRNAKKGVDIAKTNAEPNKKVSVLQKILGGCNGIISGLTEAIKNVGRGFSNIWNVIRQSISGNSNNN